MIKPSSQAPLTKSSAESAADSLHENATDPAGGVVIESTEGVENLATVAQRVRSHIDRGDVVLLKGALAPDLCASVREALLEWAIGKPEFERGTSAQIGDLNFHRIDDGSQPAHIDHRMHVLGFGTPSSLTEPLVGWLMECGSKLQKVTNAIAGTDFEIAENGLRIMAMHLPRGGGYIAPHQHPYLPNKIASILILSEPGEDYQSGGPEFRLRTGWLRLTQEQGLAQGDIVLARADIPHGFAQIDPETDLRWNAADGLWGLSCEHLSSYSEARQLDG